MKRCTVLDCTSLETRCAVTVIRNVRAPAPAQALSTVSHANMPRMVLSARRSVLMSSTWTKQLNNVLSATPALKGE